jgi:hypothetical protein
MTYPQILRLRKTLTIYGSIIGGLFLIALMIAHSPHAASDLSDASKRKLIAIPLSALLFSAAWGAIIYATAISRSLNREYDGVEMVWTKPIARERLALSYILLDFAAIVVAFIAAAALCVLLIASLGLLTHISVDNRTVPTLVIGLGAAFMWYGLMQGLTAGQRFRGGVITGVSWAAAFVFISLAEATQGGIEPLHTIFTILNVVNPLAYFSSYSLSGYGAHPSPVLPQAIAGTEMRMLMTWSLGLIGCAAAIAGWKRLEA